MALTKKHYETPWGEVGYITYKRTYARDKAKGVKEEWEDTVNRVVLACNKQLNCNFTEEESEEVKKIMMELKGTVAGRFLWQLGTKTVDQLGLPSLQNCFSGDTELLTKEGVKSLKESLNKEIEVNYEGSWYPATVKHFGKQLLQNVVLEVAGRSNHFLSYNVTKNHRWELEDGTLTTNLKEGDRIKSSTCKPQFDQEGFVHGLIFGDGSVNYKYSNGDFSNVIRLCGDKQKHKKLFPKYFYQPNCKGDPVAYIRSKDNFKEFPVNKSADYIGSFIQGWIATDDSLTPSGSYVISSQQLGAYDYLVKNAPYAGFVVSGMSTWSQPSNFGERTNPLARITLTKSKTFVVKQIVEMEEDDVYCAVVPEVERFTLAGGLRTSNCAFTVINEPIRPFTWTFEMLMLGAGVGFNIQREHVYQLPPVKKKVKIQRTDLNDADFIVPDSREGWVKLLGKVLKASFYTGEGFSFATHLIRAKGLPIKGFGGIASGSEELVKGIFQINDILNSRAGKRLRPIDCLDIMNIIGSIVVSGNVRRSAQIAIGDADDLEFLNAKRWDLGNIPNWRAMSNNSVVCDDISLLPEIFWDGYLGKGEPYGLINLEAAKKAGRTGEYQYPDPLVEGFNPCAEQGLADKETCCLAEIFLPNIENEEELKKVATYLYRINKHSLAMKCAIKETEDIVHKNMRMGIGITGYLQATETQRSWLSNTYEYLREYDKKYSKENGFNESVKLTTVKPSGTLSLLAGVTPGCHPAYSQYHIRRIRMASNLPLVEICKKHGYDVEYVRGFDGKDDYGTVVVSFPCSFPDGTTEAKDMTAVDQLEVIKRLQKEWSDNSVSCTIYYKKDELDSIKLWLKDNYKDVKTVSFLLHQDHGFDQAPLTEITKEEYEALSNKTTRIVSVENLSMEDFDVSECEGGACPIR